MSNYLPAGCTQDALDRNLEGGDYPEQETDEQNGIVTLEGCEADTLIDALKMYGPSRIGNHDLFAVLMSKLRQAGGSVRISSANCVSNALASAESRHTKMPQPSRIEVRDNYQYPGYENYSVVLGQQLSHAERHLVGLRNALDGNFPYAAEDAKPLLKELGKILDAIDESFPTDPQSVMERRYED